MARFIFRLFAGAVASVGTLGVFPSPAAAQVLVADPYRGTVVVARPSVYWGYAYNPYAHYVYAAADLTRAQGDFLIKYEQASLLRLEVRKRLLPLRKAELQHWEWELDFRAGRQNRQRERVRAAEVERDRLFPPLTQILSAYVLNNLYDELAKAPLPPAGSTLVEQDWLAHVHVTVDGRGNMGLLKNDRIFWPQLMLRADFADDKTRIDQLLAKAKAQVSISQSQSQVDPEVLRELRERIAGCLTRVSSELRSGNADPGWNMRHYIEARRILRQVDDALFILEQPDAGYFLNPLQGKTVAEVITNMRKNGVRFAAATRGDDRFYVALHRALADEVTRLQKK